MPLLHWLVLPAVFIQTTPPRGGPNFLEAAIVAVQAILIIGLVLERRRQRGVERTLQQQRDFEILVSELSSSVNMVGASDRPALVTRWLQRLGACLDVDRVSLVPAANGRHGVMPLGLGAPWGASSAYPPSDFPALTNLVGRGVVVRFARLDVLPPELASDRPAFQRHGIEAVVLVPLRHNGAVLGALALGSRAPRSWPVTLVERLEFIGAILASAVTSPGRENGTAPKPGNGNGGSKTAVTFDPHHENEIARFARVRTLGGFALSLAHELNQPLSAILANAQAARRFLATANPPIDEVRAIIDDIDADDRRAGELIHAMRALLHNRPAENVMLDPNEVVRVIARLVHGDLLLRRVTLVLDLEAPLPQVRCDLVQLQQVLLNLMMNAFEAMIDTATGDRRVIIRTRAGTDGGCVISVRDAGKGIAPEKFDRLFEQFFSTKLDGLGMGLSIARSIVESHGGRIWATNNSDAGVTFHVALPTALAKESA
jgi:signal transduction histidine kinase